MTALEIAAARTKRSGRDDAPILTNLCVVHMKLGNDEMATDYCERAVDARSQFGIAYNNRGVLRALKQNFASAAEDSAVARKRRESVDAATFTWSALASRCRNTMVIRR